MKIINRNVFRLDLFYNWTVKNKLKAHTLITSINLFYYRLVAFIYNALYEDGYFDEDN
ncbi:hypothetical protein MaLMM01_gp152 [uncultured phage]|nr:hypothetical protein MaLMM01_gp152 [uncultured phage]